MQFSPASYILFNPHGSKYFPPPVLEHTQSRFFSYVNDHVSHPYKTTGELSADNELEKMWKEVAVVCFEVPAQYFSCRDLRNPQQQQQ
jgi:hypothetical protein